MSKFGGVPVDDSGSKFGGVPVDSSTSGASPDSDQGSFLQRIKNLVIAPGSERDSSFGQSVEKAFSPSEIMKSMGHDFSENIGNIPGDIYPNTPEKLEHAFSNPLGPAGTVAGDLLGAAVSPITGTLTNLSRPVEQATGIRRELVGDAASLAIPAGDIAKLGEAGRTARAIEAVKPVVQTARKQGYVLPPAMMSEKPGVIADTLGGWSGKIKTQQAASVRNQEITDELANAGLGLPKGTHLTDQVFSDIRSKAGKAYEDVKKAVPNIQADPEYDSVVSNLGGANGHAAKHFPNITKNQGIIDLADELKTVKNFPTDAGLEVVKELRTAGTANLKALGDPSKHALGLAQRDAANAIDDLMERNIEKTGNTSAIKAYKDARKLIAKSYDIEGATNKATGHVNALGLARLGAKGRPLTDELKTISDVANAFPKAMQPETQFGGAETLSALDFFGSALALAHGNPEVAGAIMGRPLARKAVLSKGMQDKLAGTTPPSSSIIPYLYAPGVLQSGKNVLAGDSEQ